MKANSFLIVGLVRNCAKTLRNDVYRIGKAFADAQMVKWFIIESDSEDQTVDVLNKLEKEQINFSYLSLGILRYKYPKRTERIAFCRNQYLYFIANNPSYADIDYVVVTDLDNVNTKITTECVQSCFRHNDWDVCCANQKAPYYDIWALRHPLWSPNDCWKQAKQLQKLGLSRFKSVFASVYSRMIRIPVESDWIEVDSAFGGLAIYRKSILKSVNYEGLGPNGEEICEHVYLHEQIRSNGGKVFINPGLINAGLVEHARNATQIGLLHYWLSCQVTNLSEQIRLKSIIRLLRNMLARY